MTFPAHDLSAPDDDTRLLAVVGLGFEDVRQFTDEEIEVYRKDAATVLEVRAVRAAPGRPGPVHRPGLV